jgi:hypothetical protein
MKAETEYETGRKMLWFRRWTAEPTITVAAVYRSLHID